MSFYHLTPEQKAVLPTLHFCRKKAPTRMRLLTQEEYELREGFIETYIGMERFVAGDHLAFEEGLGWRLVHRASMIAHYHALTESDGEGFVLYASSDSRRLTHQIPFRVHIWHTPTVCQTAQPGDYLVYEAHWWCWPVSKEAFESLYEYVVV